MPAMEGQQAEYRISISVRNSSASLSGTSCRRNGRHRVARTLARHHPGPGESQAGFLRSASVNQPAADGSRDQTAFSLQVPLGTAFVISFFRQEPHGTPRVRRASAGWRAPQPPIPLTHPAIQTLALPGARVFSCLLRTPIGLETRLLPQPNYLSGVSPLSALSRRASPGFIEPCLPSPPTSRRRAPTGL